MEVLPHLRYSFCLQVVATDDGGNALGPANVAITIVDKNDNAPVFGSSSYTASVGESSTAGTSLVAVSRKIKVLQRE